MKAVDRQSLFDLAIQHAGSAEAALLLALENGLSLTDDIIPGQNINTAETKPNSITQYYATNQLQPATAVSATEINLSGGINYMGIEIDFIVS